MTRNKPPAALVHRPRPAGTTELDLHKAGVLHATVKLSDRRVLIFRGGPFGSAEITKP